MSAAVMVEAAAIIICTANCWSETFLMQKKKSYQCVVGMLMEELIESMQVREKLINMTLHRLRLKISVFMVIFFSRQAVNSSPTFNPNSLCIELLNR